MVLGSRRRSPGQPAGGQGSLVVSVRGNASKFEKRSGGHTSEDIYYINDQDGESRRVYLGDVMSMSFYPRRIDAHLSCSGLQASNKDCEGLTPPAFDSFGKASEGDERLRLDSFGVVLMGDTTRTGYIVSYAGKQAAVKRSL